MMQQMSSEHLSVGVATQDKELRKDYRQSGPCSQSLQIHYTGSS